MTEALLDPEEVVVVSQVTLELTVQATFEVRVVVKLPAAVVRD